MNPQAAEDTIKRLRAANLIVKGMKISHQPGQVLIPIVDAQDQQVLEGLTVKEGPDPPRAREARSYRDLLDIPEDVKKWLPRSFDVIGNVAVLRLSEEAAPYAEKIAGALVSWNQSILRVALDEGVEGEHRVRGLRPLIGDQFLTEHHENGLRLRVDLDRVYYSPRLAGERHHLATLVRPGERVLDMFAGVGPFSILIAKRVPEAKVVAVDVNPAAAECLRQNVRLNHVALDVREGDISQLAPGLGQFDRILMNLPRAGGTFLPLAFALLRPGRAIIHHYAVLSEPEVEARVQLIESLARAIGRRPSCMPRRLRTFSVRVWIWAIDVECD